MYRATSTIIIAEMAVDAARLSTAAVKEQQDSYAITDIIIISYYGVEFKSRDPALSALYSLHLAALLLRLWPTDSGIAPGVFELSEVHLASNTLKSSIDLFLLE